jgi:CheY-like chemotaxis protein
MKLFRRIIPARFRSPETLGEALVTAGYLSRRDAAKGQAAGLFQAAAERSKLTQEEILEEITGILGFEAAGAMTPPDADFLQLSGFLDVDDLRRRSVLPQPSRQIRGHYSLVTADPGELDVDAFLEQGVEILLALPSDIEHQWLQSGLSTNGTERGKSPSMRALEDLVLLARASGAAEMFLGHPEVDRYEFAADTRRFRGNLHGELVPALLRLVGDPYAVKILQTERAGPLRVAATTNGIHPILCVNWKNGLPLPLQLAPAPSTVQPIEKNAHEILLIEDDERFAALLGGVLRERNWKVAHAPDVATARSLLDRENVRPSLIVCDLHLPGTDGLDFLRSLRRQGKPCPVLVLTSDDSQETEAELVLLGADAFVRKSADPRVFLAWCRRFVTPEEREPAAA